MRKIYLSLFLLSCFALAGKAQTNAERVYTIFTTHCNNATCHNHTDKAGGLDLEGTGATPTAKMTGIRTAMWDKPSTNSYCTSKGYKIVKPSDPYRSTLFRKSHNGLDATVTRDASEGAAMGSTLSNFEAEMIRQWVIHGCDLSGNQIDTALIHDYYNGNGYASMATPPAAPAPADGFQIHLGPLFIAANSETEGYWKYDTDLPSNTEVKAVVSHFSNSSHHLIVFKVNPGMESFVPDGWRPDQAHYYEELVTAQQYADSIHLPEKTAFIWMTNAALDLNSHYINYDLSKTLAADAYVNIYTQPNGTAVQEMKSELVPNTSIYIANDGLEHTFDDDVRDPGNFDKVFLWSMGGHTHQWGTDYRVYTLDASLSEDQFIYDASYENGDPTGLFIGFDYRHPPTVTWPGFLPVIPNNGLRHYASYVNLGPGPVAWGPTSDDEMMVLYYFYLEDTTGVPIISRQDPNGGANLNLWPNPVRDELMISLENAPAGNWQISLADLSGRALRTENWDRSSGTRYRMSTAGLPAGVYFVTFTSAGGQCHTRKVLKAEY